MGGSVLSPDYEISCDPERIDVTLVHEFLRSSYWAEGRSRETVERSIRNSLCFGVYADEQQIAFARVVTDRAVFAYLADVFVVPEFRRRGISKTLMRGSLITRTCGICARSCWQPAMLTDCMPSSVSVQFRSLSG